VERFLCPQDTRHNDLRGCSPESQPPKAPLSQPPLLADRRSAAVTRYVFSDRYLMQLGFCGGPCSPYPVAGGSVFLGETTLRAFAPSAHCSPPLFFCTALYGALSSNRDQSHLHLLFFFSPRNLMQFCPGHAIRVNRLSPDSPVTMCRTTLRWVVPMLCFIAAWFLAFLPDRLIPPLMRRSGVPD